MHTWDWKNKQNLLELDINKILVCDLAIFEN